MPQIIYAPKAIRDLQRIQDFLKSKNSAAARRAAATILKEIKVLSIQPQIGRMTQL